VLGQEGNEFVRREVHLALIIHVEVLLEKLQNILNVVLDSYWCIDIHGIGECLTFDFLSLLSRSLSFLEYTCSLLHRFHPFASLSTAVNAYRGMPSTGRGRPRPSPIRRGFIVIVLPSEQTGDATTDRAAATTDTTYKCAEGLANTWHGRGRLVSRHGCMFRHMVGYTSPSHCKKLALSFMFEMGIPAHLL